MRERRKDKTSFSVLIDNEHGEKLKKHLEETQQTKTGWLIEKIDQDTDKSTANKK